MWVSFVKPVLEFLLPFLFGKKEVNVEEVDTADQDELDHFTDRINDQ